MRLFLILLGLAIAGLATFGFVYLVGRGCGMNTTGCNIDLFTLYIRHLFHDEGWIYLAIMGFAAAVLIAGLQHRK